MSIPTEPATNSAASHPGTDAVYRWLAAQFEALRAEGQVVVDDYWSRLKAGRTGRKPYERGTLGLRLRSREGGAFSLEWYEMGALGRDRIPVAKRHIAKGQSHHYPLRQVLSGQPEWLSPLVEETEAVLAVIRKRQGLVMKIRDAMARYASELAGSSLTATGLLRELGTAEADTGKTDSGNVG